VQSAIKKLILRFLLVHNVQQITKSRNRQSKN